MPRIPGAGLAEHVFSCFLIDITQILFIQESTASVVLLKGFLLPVYGIPQPVSEKARIFPVFFQ